MKFKITMGLFSKEKRLSKFIMKTFVFLCCSVMFAFAPKSSFSQDADINISRNKVMSIRQVFKTINKQTDYKFIYRNDLIKEVPELSLNKGVIKVSSLLGKYLTPHGLSYSFSENNTVIVHRAQKEKIQQFSINGIVTDTEGIPLLGANIIEKGTNNGVSTNFDGNYSINVSSSSATLVVSYIGYINQEIAVNGQSVINVKLVEDASQLDEIVVTALGIKKEKRALGYGSSTIKAQELVQTGTTNFASALYGKATGVQIQQSTGGSLSPTSITIRGINSITGDTQPLIILDGVPIRNEEVNNDNFWGNSRIRSNGLLDINPEDVESIDILKGASAAALYGSEAVNGVVLITTKSGSGDGLSVNVSTTYSQDKVAFLPQYQRKFGNGHPANFWSGWNAALEEGNGFVPLDVDGDGINELRQVHNTSVNFGPRFDGQPIMAWDGIVRPFSAQEGNFDGLFNIADNFRTNISISNVSEKSNIRFSYTRQDNEALTLNTEDDRNTFSLRAGFDVLDKVKLDLSLNYVNQDVFNRPYKIDRLINNFGGMMAAFDHADWYRDAYKDSMGYRYRTGSQVSPTPDENLIYNGRRGAILNYMWTVNEQELYEKSNRVMGVAKATYQVTDDFSIQGRVSTDFTSRNTEAKNPNIRPLWIGNPTGGYSINNWQSNIFYGDVILNYSKDVTEDINVSLLAGYNGRKENWKQVNTGTSGGLSVENWFSLGASVNTPVGRSDRQFLTRDAIFGTVEFNYKDYLYVQGTIRRDRTSTMHPDNNSFVYPSVNSSFILSEAAELPEFISFLKLRGSWGIVGNYPNPYRANIAYSQTNLGSQGPSNPVYTTISNSMGNDGIRPEEKREFEFGIEARLFNGKIDLEASYYNAQVIDQILPLSLPSSSGATSILTNIGTLRNKGIEIGIGAKVIQNENFSWDTRLNIAKNTNEIEKLAPGLDELQHANWDGGAARLVSEVGRPMGDLYAHDILRDDQGRPIVGDNGIYRVDPEWKRFGNVMPKAVGGFLNNFTYKNFTFAANMDFRIGGHVMPTGVNWMHSRGLTERSLQWRDREHGGFHYYEDANGNRFRTDADAGLNGPNGERVYTDGVIFPGVDNNGNENQNIASGSAYWNQTFNWGGPQYGNARYAEFIEENNYLKVRELALGYNFPKDLTSKIGINGLNLSFFGRNLFYIYRSLKEIDPEQLTGGTNWKNNVKNGGGNPSFRTWGLKLTASL